MKKLLYSYLLSSLTLGFGFFQPISAFAQQIDPQTNVESKKKISLNGDIKLKMESFISVSIMPQKTNGLEIGS